MEWRGSDICRALDCVEKWTYRDTLYTEAHKNMDAEGKYLLACIQKIIRIIGNAVYFYSLIVSWSVDASRPSAIGQLTESPTPNSRHKVSQCGCIKFKSDAPNVPQPKWFNWKWQNNTFEACKNKSQDNLDKRHTKMTETVVYYIIYFSKL